MTHVRIRHGDWVFVGDGRKALLLCNEGDPDLLDLRRVEVREDDNPPSREQGSDGPGRSAVNIGPRSAIDATDWHALEEERFAKTVAERLNRAAEANQFEHIVIAAPPKVLGELRRYEEALPELQKAAKLDPTLPDMWYRLGIVRRLRLDTGTPSPATSSTDPPTTTTRPSGLGLGSSSDMGWRDPSAGAGS